MNTNKLLLTLILLVAGVGNGLFAQTAVTVGSQVTNESSLVSGKAYLVYYVGNGSSGYMKDTGSAYTGQNDNTSTTAAVYIFTSNGDNTWKVQNYHTGKYWGVPPATNATTTASSDTPGTWTLNFQSGGNIAPSAPDAGGTQHSWNRSGSSVHCWSSGTAEVNQFKIQEVALSSTALSEFAGKDIQVSSTEAASLSTNTWYVMSQRPRTSYVYEDASSHTLKHTQTKPSGSATDKAGFCVRLISGADGKYILQTGLGNMVGQITASTNVPTASLPDYQFTIGKIASTDGHFYVQCTDNSVILDANDFSLGDPATVVGWETTVPTATGGNNDWAFYPIEFVPSWEPTIDEVYTINNTNPSRGALIYNSSNPDYVWSSGKSGTFNASEANSQWVIVPTGTEGQYYLYNVGAGKFAVPTGSAQGAQNPWKFSSNAVAVKLLSQSDGTYKIQMATAPVSGTNTAYLAVSNGQTYPIINYNDVGGNFTITKVDGQDQSTAATAAVNKLVKSLTALTASPATSGWYAIQIKSKTGSASYAGRYLYEASSLYSDLYPLTFTGDVDVQPAITDPTFFTYLHHTSWDVNTWQLPDGRYLVNNGSNKFPTPSATAGNVKAGYDNGNYFKDNNNYYADPYNSNANYFIGETTSMRTAYTVYPIDLDAAGLVAWQILCDAAPETTAIACTRSDVSGLTTVYKNGYIFLPTGVTPESSDFTLDGATSVTVDATAKTVTLEYNPNLAIVAGGVSVAQGWQTAGRDSEVLLLRVNATPFADATGATLNVSLLDGAESQISALTLYEANSDSPEILSAGNSGAPTKTQVGTTAIDGSSATATLAIGDLTAGNHYYWLGATVKAGATLGTVIDAAVTGITYTRNSAQTTLDLTEAGNPADRGAMVFNTHSYPFLPWDNGSHVYRIPAMAVADDGSIIAAVDKRYGSHTDIGNGHVIDIVVRRSTDGGKTWGDPVVVAQGDNSTAETTGYGDPTLLRLADGTLVLTSCSGNLGFGSGLKTFIVSKSTDNGVTWSAPSFVTSSNDKLTVKPSIGDFFITSGQGIVTPEGIMMYLVVSKYNGANTNFVIYSTDNGEHWTIDDQVVYNNGDEAKLEQLNDGSLIASIRQGNGRGFNFGTYTKNNDGTVSFSWGTQYQNTQLHNGGNANNQDILYYSRNADGEKDILLHSMTTGTHANLNLYMSFDAGKNWLQAAQLQSKGTRYVTMSKLPNGDLALLFEDQSLNAAGNNSSQNHYPINFISITKEQILGWYDSLVNTAYPATATVKNSITSSTTGCDNWGTFSDKGSQWSRTWTSNAASGIAGLTITSNGYGFDKATVYSTRAMTLRPSADGATDVITITAPAGYVIDSYTITGRNYSADQTYKFWVDESNQITTSTSGGTLTVDNVNATSTSFNFYGSSASSNYLCITNFVIQLKAAKELSMTAVGEASYATLFMPYAVSLPAATKAFVVDEASDGSARMVELSDGVPALTPAIIVNSEKATSILAPYASSVEAYTGTNLLRGTLVSRSLDLSEASPYFALGKYDNAIGFYKFDNNGTTSITLGANKAYLEVPASSSGVKGFTFSFDPITGIGAVQPTAEGVQQTAGIFNLAGQRVSKPAKGVYIIGGRKILMK